MINVVAEPGGKFALLRAEHFREHFLQDQAGAYACNHRRQKASTLAANRPEHDQFKNNPQDGSANDGGGKRRYRPDVEREHHLQTDIGSDHEHLAMGEMNEPKHPEDQGISDRDQRVGAAKHQTVGDLLQQHKCLRRAVGTAHLS